MSTISELPNRGRQWSHHKHELLLALGLDWLALILTVVLVLASMVLLAVICFPRIRKRLGFGEDFKKDLVWPLMIGVVPIIVTHTFAKAISESETRAKYVELGVGILRSEPAKKAENEHGGMACPELSEHDEALRTWAYKLIDTYSEVGMDDVAKTALICRGLKIITGTGNIQLAPDTARGTIIVE